MIHILMKMNYNFATKLFDIADNLDPESYTSREFIMEIGRYLKSMLKKRIFN